MRARSLLVLSVGFGTLLLLIGLLGFGAIRQARPLLNETISTHDAYTQADAALREIPTDLYLGSVLIRDYLLDPSHLRAPSFREQLLERRAAAEKRLDVVARRVGEGEADRFQELRKAMREYWESMNPILAWSPAEKAAFSQVFLRQQVLPRREAVIALARQVEEMNDASLRAQQQRLRESQESFLDSLRGTLYLALSIGLLVALTSFARVAFLERRSEQQRERAEHAEEELRRLSRSLVRAQEEERRSLSRELHDAVGQMLSAMTMELANLEAAVDSPAKLRLRLEEARRLNSDTIRGVRELAMGLRPTMLDELGLGPALRWQGREFSRRSGVPVTVQIDGDVEDLPESHRTCVYRVVQEALTNCARHAQAKSIRISVFGGSGRVRLSIQDDGVGFDPGERSGRGIGLLGIQERVRELGGSVDIISQRRKGTILEAEIPIGQGAPAV